MRRAAPCGASPAGGFPSVGIWRWGSPKVCRGKQPKRRALTVVATAEGSQGTFSGEVSPEKLPPRCSKWRACGVSQLGGEPVVPESGKPFPQLKSQLAINKKG